MSKAFTSEQNDVEPLLRPLPQGRRPITAQGYDALARRLRQWADVERPPLAVAAQEHVEARTQLRALERKMQEVSTLMSLCDVIDASKINPQVVALGTQVEVQDGDGVTSHFALVGPDEIDIGRGRISPMSPIGRALMGTSVGTEITIDRPKGAWTVEVVSILPLGA